MVLEGLAAVAAMMERQPTTAVRQAVRLAPVERDLPLEAAVPQQSGHQPLALGETGLVPQPENFVMAPAMQAHRRTKGRPHWTKSAACQPAEPERHRETWAVRNQRRHRQMRSTLRSAEPTGL